MPQVRVGVVKREGKGMLVVCCAPGEGGVMGVVRRRDAGGSEGGGVESAVFVSV